MVLTIELTKEQLSGFLELIDMSLKLNGISGLQKTVELVNVLNSAKPTSAPESVEGNNG